jgi:hypothetical protein
VIEYDPIAIATAVMAGIVKGVTATADNAGKIFVETDGTMSVIGWDNKVDKVAGKGLSTNDYTDTDKAAIAGIANKVDKIAGKGLSANDYTDADKEAVESIDGKQDKLAGDTGNIITYGAVSGIVGSIPQKDFVKNDTDDVIRGRKNLAAYSVSDFTWAQLQALNLPKGYTTLVMSGTKEYWVYAFPGSDSVAMYFGFGVELIADGSPYTPHLQTFICTSAGTQYFTSARTTDLPPAPPATGTYALQSADSVVGWEAPPASIPEAPEDNKLYGRKNAAWEEVQDGGTDDYNDLNNKPSIAGVTLEGNKTLADLGISAPVDYSTTEQDTGIKWIDGKKIYSRAFTGNITSASATTASVNLMSGAEGVINYGGYWKIATSQAVNMSVHDVSVIGRKSNLQVSSNIIYFYTISDLARADCPYNIWVEYTKSS